MVRCVCSPISLRRLWSFRKRMAVTGNDLGTFNSLKEQGERGWCGIWKMVAEQLSKKMASTDLFQYYSMYYTKIHCHSSQLPFLTVQHLQGCWKFQLTHRGFGYDSTDCAAVRHRVQEEKAQRVIYVIDNGQDTEQSMFLCWGWREEAGS